MTAVAFTDGSQFDESSTNSGKAEAEYDRSSQRWRSLWRIHFYSGIFAIPFILLMSVTGLAILYDQPIKDVVWKDLRTVTVPATAMNGAAPTVVSYTDQEKAVETAYPKASVVSLTVPRNATTATQFGLDNGHVAYVNQYTGAVLGENNPNGGFMGVFRRLHGQLNNTWKVSLPTVSALWDGGAIMRPYVIGDHALVTTSARYYSGGTLPNVALKTINGLWKQDMKDFATGLSAKWKLDDWQIELKDVYDAA